MRISTWQDHARLYKDRNRYKGTPPILQRRHKDAARALWQRCAPLWENGVEKSNGCFSFFFEGGSRGSRHTKIDAAI